MIEETLLEAEEKMEKAVEVAKEDFAGIRTGRATPGMFNKLMVDYYGAPTPLQQLASFTSSEARIILISPYDIGAMNAIEKAIRESDLGLEPSTQGAIIRVPLPQMNEQRRKELVKVVHKMAEEGRIAVRHARTAARDRRKPVGWRRPRARRVVPRAVRGGRGPGAFAAEIRHRLAQLDGGLERDGANRVARVVHPQHQDGVIQLARHL